MRALDIARVVLGFFGRGEVQCLVGPEQTFVAATPLRPYAMISFTEPRRLADALAIDRKAIEESVTTEHVWNGKKVAADYNIVMTIHIKPDDVTTPEHEVAIGHDQVEEIAGRQ